MNAPIIRIEVESMKLAMMHAFSEQLVNMDSLFKSAIEEACNPAKIHAILTDAASRYIAEAIQSETKAYLIYGDGRKLIASKVIEQLRADYGGAQ